MPDQTPASALATTSAESAGPSPSESLTSSSRRSASVSLPASPDSVPRFPPTASLESYPSALPDDFPTPSSSCGRSPPLPDCVLPLAAPARGSLPGLPLPSDARTSLSVQRSANHGLFSSLSARHGCTVSACQHSGVGYRSCCAPDSNPLVAPRFSSFSSSVPWFFGPSLQPHYQPSLLLRPLLTSPQLSPRRSPQVRFRICSLAPTGSTWCVLVTLGLRCCQPACRPHPASLPVRVPTVVSLLSASFGFASRLRLAVSLRLPSSAPIGSFHPTRFCPCWPTAGCGAGAPPHNGVRRPYSTSSPDCTRNRQPASHPAPHTAASYDTRKGRRRNA